MSFLIIVRAVIMSLFSNLPIITSSIISPYGVHPFVKNFGDLCDWRDQSEYCDQPKGLACSYKSSTCECWDLRKIYSLKAQRCVGKAGEECAFSESERLCTENAYCLEERSLSHIPICMCLKGYFRSENGSCIQYSKHGEPCEPYPSMNAICEPENGLKCFDFKCRCDADQIYDPVKDLCLARAGQRCSRTLNNCVENAECNQKIWALDRITGETHLGGFRCGCKHGLKITDEGFCASEFGGVCEKSSECYPGEDLNCLNGICQCFPLSQIYDKKLRRCFNLAGTTCQAQGNETEKNVNSTEAVRNVSNASTILEKEDPKRVGGVECIQNSECVSNSCKCVNGSSETIIKTCLLNYGQPCQSQQNEVSQISQSRQMLVLENEMQCNVFEGLICHSDSGKCLCADPSLVYDKERKSCVAMVGEFCGNLRLDVLELSEEFKQLIFINCDSTSQCLEKSVNGKSKRICVPKGSFGSGRGGSSLTNIMVNNANLISESTTT